jgi:hypothetical protein
MRRPSKECSFGFLFPSLNLEWDYEENELTPFDYFPHSESKVYWQCSNGHKWEATVSSRANGNGCPCCSGRKACEENCLSTVNPELSKEWHPTLNKGLSPKDITPNSNKKVYWKCDKGHEWEASVSNRSKGRGCPYCANKIVLPENSISTTHPDLVAQWDYNRNANISPLDISAGSSKQVWWVCSKGHSWKASIGNRTRDKSSGKCPFCTGRKVCIDNCLATVRPDLVAEWHPIKNDQITPYSVTAGCGKKVWWLCKRGHEWQAVIRNRTNKDNLTGCPYCNSEFHTSFPEQAILFYMKKVFKDVENQITLVSDIDADIFIPRINLAIEYDGYFAHNTLKKMKRDELKNIRFSEQGIKLIRIRECINNKELPLINNYNSLAITYYVERGYSNLSDCVSNLFGIMLNNYKELLEKEEITSIENINISTQEDKLIIYNEFISAFKENSLLSKNPEIAEEWDFESNLGMLPEYFAPYSNIEVNWKCKNGHKYRAAIHSRTRGNSGCPYCGGKKVCWDNCLENLRPDIAKLWHTNKNGKITPLDVTVSSGKIFWWKCDCGSEWQDSVDLVTRFNNRCPKCYPRNPSRGSKTRGTAFHISDSLANKFPDIASEWDYEANGELTPNDISFGYGGKVGWKCKSGHKWVTTVNLRTFQKTGCPYCSNEKVGIDNCLATLCSDLIKEWHPTKNEKLTPFDVMPGSTSRVWWLCSKCQHEWNTEVRTRAKQKTGCPSCKKTPNETNSLKGKNPNLAKEWHPTMNNPLTPDNVFAGSNSKAWWKCPKCNYEWNALINSRNSGSGCPNCRKFNKV